MLFRSYPRSRPGTGCRLGRPPVCPGPPYTYAKITKGVFKSLKDCGMIISDIYLCRFARITEEKEAFNKNEHTPIEHFGDLGARVPRAGDN